MGSGDVVMGGVGGGRAHSAQALVVHGVSCAAGLRAVERCAHRLNLGVFNVRGCGYCVRSCSG